MTQEPLLNTQKNISRLADLYVFMHAFSTPPFSFLSGRIPLQYPWLWLDRGWLHSWGPEVSDAAAGALSLHRPVCHLRAPLWCRQCGEINVTVKESFILTWIKVSCGHEAPEVIFWWHDWSKGTLWEMSFQELDKKVDITLLSAFIFKWSYSHVRVTLA